MSTPDLTTPEDRLAAMGLTLPAVAAPLAAYVPALRTGNYVYTSGQLPTVNGELVAVGKVGTGDGASVSPEEATAAARICALNALAALRGVVGELSAVVRIVKVLGFVASAPDFFAQAQVINGASELLLEVFGVGPNGTAVGAHARSAIGVAVLPRDAPVEVELIAEVTPA
ncbi:MAG TPA: RidA family protein [Acidothermaceae bacterium]|jgi:enamine deaminase RidA (YjgF/YER057c/UK114 family)